MATSSGSRGGVAKGPRRRAPWALVMASLVERGGDDAYRGNDDWKSMVGGNSLVILEKKQLLAAQAMAAGPTGGRGEPLRGQRSGGLTYMWRQRKLKKVAALAAAARDASGCYCYSTRR